MIDLTKESVMAFRFDGEGNLGEQPELKLVTRPDGEERQVANLRIYFDRRVKNPQAKPGSKDEYIDKGGFWLTGAVWGNQAEHAVRVLSKGARVAVSGTMYQHEWTDTDGHLRLEHRLSIERVSLALSRVESVTLKPKSAQAYSGASGQTGDHDGFEVDDVDVPEAAFTA
jgi:single-strand DNA-binding protein